MVAQIVAQLRIERAGIAALPIEHHPIPHQIGIERTGTAQHEIDARRLVEEIRLVELPAHLLFETPDQPREQHPFKHMAIDRAVALGQLGRLGQPRQIQEADLPMHGQGPGRVEQRHDPLQIVIVDRVEIDGGKLLPIDRDRLRRRLDGETVGSFGPNQQKSDDQRRRGTPA